MELEDDAAPKGRGISNHNPRGRHRTLTSLEKMPTDVRACIASMDFDPNTGRVTKVRFWDKNAALEKAMKHHGLYERNNNQKGENLKVSIGVQL